MPERTRKRVFRRSLQGSLRRSIERSSIGSESNDVLRKLVQEANGYLLKIAELEEELQSYNCDVKESSAEVPEARVVTGDHVNADLHRLDEATAFLRQLACLDEKPLQEVENTEQMGDVGTWSSGVGDSAAPAEGDGDRLWDEFVLERSAKKGGKEIVKEKKTKSWLGKIASRLFRRK